MWRTLLVVSLLLVAACDLFDDDDPVVFDGVEVEAAGDARLAVVDGALVVSGLEGSRSGGFVVAGTPDRVDVETDPITIPQGGNFGVRVEDAGTVVASVYNEGLGNGRFDMRFSFADALGVEAVTVRYRLGGEIVLEIPDVLNVGLGNRQRFESSAGTGSGDSGSVHVIRSGGRYIVVADSGPQEAQRRQCDGFLVVPPGIFGSDFPDGLCTDWVEVEPVGGRTMPAGRVFVTARGVGAFRVRDLQAQSQR